MGRVAHDTLTSGWQPTRTGATAVELLRLAVTTPPQELMQDGKLAKAVASALPPRLHEWNASHVSAFLCSLPQARRAEPASHLEACRVAAALRAAKAAMGPFVVASGIASPDELARLVQDPVELIHWAKRNRAEQLVSALLRSLYDANADNAATAASTPPAIDATRVLCLAADESACAKRTPGACESAVSAVLDDAEAESSRKQRSPNPRASGSANEVDASDIGATASPTDAAPAVEATPPKIPALLAQCNLTPLELVGTLNLRSALSKLRHHSFDALLNLPAEPTVDAVQTSNLLLAAMQPTAALPPLARFARSVRNSLRSTPGDRLAAFHAGPLAEAVEAIASNGNDTAAVGRIAPASLGASTPAVLDWLAGFPPAVSDSLISLALGTNPVMAPRGRLASAAAPLRALENATLCEAAIARMRMVPAQHELAAAVLSAVAPAAVEWAKLGSVAALTAAANAWSPGGAACIVLSLLHTSPEHPMRFELHEALAKAPAPALSRLLAWGGKHPSSFARDCTLLVGWGILYNVQGVVEVAAAAAGNLAGAADASDGGARLRFAESCHAAALQPWQKAIAAEVSSDAVAKSLVPKKSHSDESSLEAARSRKWSVAVARLGAVARAALRAVPLRLWQAQHVSLWFAAGPEVATSSSGDASSFAPVLPFLAAATRACELDGKELGEAFSRGDLGLEIASGLSWPGSSLTQRAAMLRLALTRGGLCENLANEMLARTPTPCADEWSNGPTAFEIATGGKEAVVAATGTQIDPCLLDVADLSDAAARLRPVVAARLAKRNVTTWSSGDVSCWLGLHAPMPPVWLSRVSRSDVAAPGPLNGLAIMRLGAYAVDALDRNGGKVPNAAASTAAASVTAPLGMGARSAAALAWALNSPSGYATLAAWALEQKALRPVLATEAIDKWRASLRFGGGGASAAGDASTSGEMGALLTPQAPLDSKSALPSTPLERAMACDWQPCAKLREAALRATCIYLVEEAGPPLSWTADAAAAYVTLAGRAEYAPYLRADSVSGRRLLEMLHHAGLSARVDATTGAPGLPVPDDDAKTDASGDHPCDRLELKGASLKRVATALEESLDPLALSRAIVALGRSMDAKEASVKHTLTYLLQTYPEVATAPFHTERGAGTLYGSLRGLDVEWVNALAKTYVLPFVQNRLKTLPLRDWGSADVANHLYAKAAKLRGRSPPMEVEATAADRTAEALLRVEARGVDFAGCMASVAPGTETLSSGEEVEKCLEDPKALLQFAAAETRPALVRFLFRGRLVGLSDAVDTHGQSLMLTAAWTGDEDLARVLLEHGVDGDAAGTGGQTPLHRASLRGNTGVVRLLLSTPDAEGMPPGTPPWSVDVHRRNHRGKTALHLAQSKGHDTIERLLAVASSSPPKPPPSKDARTARS